MKPATKAQIRTSNRCARDTCKLHRPFRIRVCLPEGGDDQGFAHKDRRGFLVELRIGMPHEMYDDALLHELAHCLAWVPGSPFHRDHGPHWGVAYSQLYQVFHGVQ